MVTIRLPAVEARFGAVLGTVDAPAVLCLLGQPETDDLDFKREIYAAGAAGNSDLSDEQRGAGDGRGNAATRRSG
jgi:hypothetical protein